MESANKTAPVILDSGERTHYKTGAVRDFKVGKGRCDLMPLDVLYDFFNDAIFNDIEKFRAKGDTFELCHAIILFWDKRKVNYYSGFLEIAKHFEEGAEKYGPNNWQKGIPVHSYIDSAVRHYLKLKSGMTDEPHERAFVWNLMCCIWTMKHHPELDDFTVKHEDKDDV